MRQDRKKLVKTIVLIALINSYSAKSAMNQEVRLSLQQSQRIEIALYYFTNSDINLWVSEAKKLETNLRFVNSEAQCTDGEKTTMGREHKWSPTIIKNSYHSQYAICTIKKAGKNAYAEIRVCDENSLYPRYNVATVRIQTPPSLQEELKILECVKTRIPARGGLFSKPEMQYLIKYADSVVIRKGETREIIGFSGPAPRKNKVEIKCNGAQCGSLSAENGTKNMARPVTLYVRTDETVRIKYNGRALGQHNVLLEVTIELT